MDISSFKIPKLLSEIEQRISDSNSFKLVNDENGFLQPRLCINNKECIYVTKILKVAIVKEEVNRVALIYMESFNDGILHAEKLKKTSFRVNGNSNLVGLYLSGLKDMYFKEKKMFLARYENKIEKTKSNLFSINEGNLEKICSGNKEVVSDDLNLEVNYVGKIQFEDCEYDIKYKGLQDTIAKNIEKIYSKQNNSGAVVFCGNATKTSALKCPQFKNFEGCNGKLTIDRASTVAAYVHGLLEDKLTQTSFIPYANDTKLDEKNVRVFYVLLKESKY